VDGTITNRVEPIQPEQGIVTLYGYNACASVERGHLILNDGVGMSRRRGRFSRVRHGLKRLVVIGSTGLITFEALRWLADQRAAFVMLDRNGSVLAVTGPVGPSDARLRRAQSLAHQSNTAMHISAELISQKIKGQERLLRESLKDPGAADIVAATHSQLRDARSISAVRQVEALAAKTYWTAWREVPVRFPTVDLAKTPEHWRVFGTRKSPITGSPRLAVNPGNAMLNYMYALLESEARLAAAAMGLDPGIGFLHVDTDARDSLACDLMEAIRPRVDSFLLDWLLNQPLRREWFFEQRDGSCKLMAQFAKRLSGSLPAWRQELAPITEWVSNVLWTTFKHSRKWKSAPTHLSQMRRGKIPDNSLSLALPRVTPLCSNCGKAVSAGSERCGSCKVTVCTEALIKAAQKGRLVAKAPKARAKQAKARRRHAAALKAWHTSDLPNWLNAEVYRRDIQPRLATVTVPAIRQVLEISKIYATHIRSGKREPHPRHWQKLANLVGFSSARD
jgi:CRISPR-associated endonuclease Cas1